VRAADEVLRAASAESKQGGVDLERDVLEPGSELQLLLGLADAPPPRVVLNEEVHVGLAVRLAAKPRRRHELGVRGEREAARSILAVTGKQRLPALELVHGHPRITLSCVPDHSVPDAASSADQK
jgi:hypothetical protein